MDHAWIVVANQTYCRILTYAQGHPVTEAESLVCPEGRQSGQTVLADAPGRSHDRKGAARHAMEPRTGIREQASTKFAKRIARRINEACESGDCRSLILVAAPRLLGMIRPELSDLSRKRLESEVQKDLANWKVEDIVCALPSPIQANLRARRA